MFSKQDFDSATKVLAQYANLSNVEARTAVHSLARSMAQTFANSNPQFSVEIFLDQAGVPPEDDREEPGSSPGGCTATRSGLHRCLHCGGTLTGPANVRERYGPRPLSGESLTRQQRQRETG